MIYRGDDTDFNDEVFLTIRLRNPKGIKLSKAIFRSGQVHKTFINPEFPLKVSLNSEETMLLDAKAIGRLAVFDEKGRKRTLKKSIIFETEGKVV